LNLDDNCGGGRGKGVSKVLALYSGSLSSRVASKLAELHKDISCVHLLHFRSPFSRDFDDLRQFLRAERSHATYRTQSIKKEYLTLVGFSEHGEFSLVESCARCRALLYARAARYMERIDADYLLTGEVTAGRKLGPEDLERIEDSQGLTRRILRPLCSTQLTDPGANLATWLRPTRRARSPKDLKARCLDFAAEHRMVLEDPMACEARCKLATPGFGERVTALFRGEGVTLNALCLLDFPLYYRIEPDVQLVLARDENEKRELQNLFLPQDLRVYPSTPHAPMTLVRTDWRARGQEEQQEIIEFVSRVTATYAHIDDSATIPIYYRFECEDETNLLNAEPFESVEEIEAMRSVELIPLMQPRPRVKQLDIVGA